MKHSQAFLRLASLFCVLALTAVLSTGCSGDDKKKKESSSSEAAVSSEITAVAVSERESSETESKKPEPADQSPENRYTALDKAKLYLEYNAYSRDGLIEQLEFEGYPAEETTAAVDSLNVNWNEQAVKSVLDYVDKWDYSRQQLLEYLTKEQKFTQEQAEYGVDHCGADWKKAVALRAREYMDIAKLPRGILIHSLLKDGFTKEEAEYGADSVLK